MPIVDVRFVMETDAEWPPGLTQDLADALGDLLGAPPGQVWVRLVVLPATHYAENRAAVERGGAPVFVTLLQARPPQGPERAEQCLALTRVVATVTGRRADRIHIEYAPDGAGRVAFGGRLVA